MYNSDSSRNPWGDDRFNYNNTRDSIDDLKKAIREQKILLAAAGVEEDDVYESINVTIDELKRRIVGLTQEIYDKQHNAANRGRSTLTPAQWWSRYQLNLRQLEDIADQRQALLKEINYLVGTGMKDLEDELKRETEKLNMAKMKAVQVRRAAFSPASSFDQPGMTESERIRAKAQAMVALRLGKGNSSSTSLYGSKQDNGDDEEAKARQRTEQVNNLLDGVSQLQREVESIMEKDLKKVDEDLDIGTKQLKDRQMFEQGLYVDDEVVRFIDKLDRSITTSEKRTYNTPPPPPPPLYGKSLSTSSYSQAPPPIPTSQRPGTPRSEADIKAEAYRRIEERRKHFIKDASKRHAATTAAAATESQRSVPEDSKISEEEKAAQERMRQAEAEARARLDSMREKREKLRKEAAEAEEKKRKAAAEASAAAEAEMLSEKKRKQQEEEERQARIKKAQEELAEQQRKQREAELERLRLERQEKERIEVEECKKRDEEERLAEEMRIQKARKAAEQAAHEKRLRRKEIERREKEIEAARLEEFNRRKQWEQAENQKRLDEERRIREKEEEAARIRQRLDEEEEEARAEQEEQRRRDEEERLSLEAEVEAQKRAEEERIKEQKLKEEQALREAEKKLQKEERELAAAKEAEYTSSPISSHHSIQNSTTAGTSGYGVDIEDEVNFSISKFKSRTLHCGSQSKY